MDIKVRIRQLQNEHGGVRPAARAIGISASYLIRLRDSERLEPSDCILRKLGLRKRVTYTRITA